MPASTLTSTPTLAATPPAAPAAPLPPQRLQPPVRAEYERTLEPLGAIRPSAPLPWLQRIWSVAAVRRAVILALLAALWQALAVWQDNDLLLPSFTATLQALIDGLAGGELLTKAGISLVVLLQGYALGIAGALVLTTLAVSTNWGAICSPR